MPSMIVCLLQKDNLPWVIKSLYACWVAWYASANPGLCCATNKLVLFYCHLHPSLNSPLAHCCIEPAPVMYPGGTTAQTRRRHTAVSQARSTGGHFSDTLSHLFDYPLAGLRATPYLCLSYQLPARCTAGDAPSCCCWGAACKVYWRGC
jgi:hypothetical protein